MTVGFHEIKSMVDEEEDESLLPTSQDSLLVRAPDFVIEKVASSNPGRSGGRIFFS